MARALASSVVKRSFVQCTSGALLAALTLFPGCERTRTVAAPVEQPPSTASSGEVGSAMASEPGPLPPVMHKYRPEERKDHGHGSGVSGLRAAPAATAGPAPLAPARAQPSVAHRLDLSAGSAGIAGSAQRGQPLIARKPSVAPPPRDDNEAYQHITDNPFLAVNTQPLSTFSVDVDTASYSNARRFLAQGSLPPQDAIRVEEWLNYFAYDYAAPTGNAPFSVNTEVTTCPWNTAHRLARIGIRGRSIEQDKVPPRNLVFLIDVSGSMMSPDKLPLVKRGLAMLADTLRPQDSLAIAVYAGNSGLALPATSGRERGKILNALEGLEAGGSTNGGEGIRLAYAVAQEQFKEGGVNRVILATDGDFNVGTTSEGELQRLIEEKRKSAVFLTVLGFGTGNVKDSTMEMLADKGNGNYAYIDSLSEARKVLVREAGATLVTIAKDVKLQVEFNPARVSSYKLIGYENRLLAKEDFNDDRKDAGEIGAGHTVTALYEIVPSAASDVKTAGVDALKYQGTPALTAAADRPELLTVNVRYKDPTSETSTKLSVVIGDEVTPLTRASADARFGIGVANVALLLRGSPDVAQSSLESARELAASGVGEDPHGDRREFLAMIDQAKRLK
jgi:Ca-activated chloride channel family protein